MSQIKKKSKKIITYSKQKTQPHMKRKQQSHKQKRIELDENDSDLSENFNSSMIFGKENLAKHIECKSIITKNVEKHFKIHNLLFVKKRTSLSDDNEISDLEIIKRG